MVSCTLQQSDNSRPPVEGKKSKKASSQPASIPSKVYEVVLHDTVLFPEGGGQAHDIGTITAEDGSLWDVEFVKRHGGVAVHYVNIRDGFDVVPELFATGKKVRLALGEEGFKRRLDHVRPFTSYMSIRV